MKRIFTMLALMVTLTLGANSQTLYDAMKANQAEMPGKAKSILLGILAKTPTDAEANYRMGNLYYQLGRKDSAKYYFEKGINAEDKINYNFAGVGKLALDEKNTTVAEDNFNRLTGYGKSKDNKAYTFVGEAYLHSANQDLTKAISQLEKAILMNGIKNAEAQLLLGEAYLLSKDAGKAVRKYEYAIEADSTNGYPYMKIGQVYMQSGAYEEALKNFQRGIKNDPEFAPIQRELAEINYYTKNFSEAARLYKIYIDKTGADVNKQTRYASFLFLNKEYDKTIGIIEDIMKKDSSNVILSRLIGYSYYEQEKYEQGLNFMKRFFEKADPAKIIGSDYAYYGKLLAKTGNDSLAVVYLYKAIEADPQNPDLYNDLAQTLYVQKKYVEAAGIFEKMLALKKGSSNDYFLLGKTYYFAASSTSNQAKETADKVKKKELADSATSNYLKADTAFMKVTTMQPTLATGYFWRARANAGMDEENEQGLAKPHYEKFIELTTDEVKYKKDLVEAYQSVAYYYVVKKDYSQATVYYKKIQELDPGNKNAESFFKAMEDQREYEKKLKEQQQNKPKPPVPQSNR